MILQVHAYIEVTSAKAGLDFYCGGLGLTLKRQYSPRWLELTGAGTPLFLLAEQTLVADLGRTTATRDYTRHWTPVHLDFITDDLAGTLERLMAHGATLDRAVKQRDYGRIANMADPFGNGFDLIEFSGSGYDAVSRG